ncbi:hypothetical protein ABN028_19910 [Actinopolymorpha sp. B17G11]|uniref:hypothetical protein n=1 Tax=Actinopolymorpha sp. B17G11 TaxID=3160861 RepID=UPI0032E47444
MSWFKAHVTPPDFIRKPQPSMLQLLNKARWGEQNPVTGFGRVVSVALYGVLWPYGVILRYLTWVFENPSRLLVHFALAWLAHRTPYLGNVLDVVVAVIAIPIKWLISLL